MWVEKLESRFIKMPQGEGHGERVGDNQFNRQYAQNLSGSNEKDRHQENTQSGGELPEKMHTVGRITTI